MNNLENLISDWQRDVDSLQRALSSMIDALIREENRTKIHQLRCNIYEYKVRIFSIKKSIGELKQAIESDKTQNVNTHEQPNQ